MDRKNELVKLFLERGYLVSPEFLDEIPDDFSQELFSSLEKKGFVLDPNAIKSLLNRENLIKIPLKIVEPEKNLCEPASNIKSFGGGVIVLKGYKDKFKKREVGDFVNYFRNRFDSIKKILINRPELQNLISINRLKLQQDGKEVAVMGLISSKTEAKTGSLIITLEDVTGEVKLIVNKNKEQIYNLAKDLVLDEVVGIVGINKGDVLFVNNIISPDIISNYEIKKSPDECYSVFISDIHFGLKNFLEKDFNNFLDWLNGKYGNEEQKKISDKVKYLFIAGDLVEGIGIYPGQDKDLNIDDIYKQYEYAAELLSKIPERIKIIICAGNHDAVRMSEPQPGFDIRFSKPIFNLKNVTLVTNPSLINIHASKDFPGFNVLLYHGSSIPYLCEDVESIRIAGGIEKPELVMKFLLQKRHLAPTYGYSLFIPDICEDFLVIDKVPDFFVTGHIHKAKVLNYKNVTCINASCWVTQTRDMERRGIFPEPSRAMVVNLKTRDIKIMSFENEK